MANALYDGLFAPHRDSARPLLRLKDGSRLGYGGFLDIADRFAHALDALGLRKGDRVAVQIEKSPEALAVCAACVQAGLVLVPLNIAYTADEAGDFVADSGARLLICDARLQAALEPVAAASGARLLTLNADGSGGFAAAAAAAAAVRPVDCGPEDLAALLYTSGTTGRAKGAMLSHGNLLSNAQALAEAWRFTRDDILLHALPIFHTHGLFVAVNTCVVAGASMILLPKFDIDDLIGLMPQASVLMGVPTFYTRLLGDPRLTRALAGPMRLFISGSAPLLAETHAAFETRTGHRILERYGTTETGMNTSNPYAGDRRAGSVGLPLPGVTVKITDPGTGAEQAAGAVGMIEVAGPNVFQGYWRMPEKTRAELRPDGFFVTGDLGRLDARGYLHIVGRQKDLIISGGANIYPAELERRLDEDARVVESAVIGVPHPDFGEGVVAVVVAEAATEPAAILAGLRGRIARFKQPQRLFVVEALPRNAMGKVQKNLLRERFASCLTEPPETKP